MSLWRIRARHPARHLRHSDLACRSRSAQLYGDAQIIVVADFPRDIQPLLFSCYSKTYAEIGPDFHDSVRQPVTVTVAELPTVYAGRRRRVQQQQFRLQLQPCCSA